MRGHTGSTCLEGGSRHAVELATSTVARMRGLLLRAPCDDVTLVLVPCRDVHTFGMRCAIDVALVGADGRVLEVRRGVGACRRVRRRGAFAVVERFAREGPWLEPGDFIWSDGLRGRTLDDEDGI